MKKLALLCFALVAAFAITACGTKSEDVTPVREEFRVALDWYANPDHAGFFVAEDRGYFEDAGLDVSLDSPTDPSLPIKLVAAGRTDLAISYEPEVLLARQQGLDVVSVATIVGVPLTSMIWLDKSKIRNVAGLRGKTISTAGIPYQDAYLGTILERAGLSESDVKKVGVGQGLLPSIISGRAQATLGPLWNIEGVDLKLSGLKPVISPVDQLGVPNYSELVLVANSSRVADDPEPIELFLKALERGTADAVAMPGMATETVIAANEGLDRKTTTAQMRVTLPLLAQRNGDKPFGYMDTARWQTFIDWAVESEVLTAPQRAVDVLSNALLPTGEVDAR
ncbi:MAG: ABC transporter substrate-binding protein [Solirubrobacterales bacterium]